jgi:dipeptidyl aminopeptidase/acylaminoacyl peptidase
MTNTLSLRQRVLALAFVLALPAVPAAAGTRVLRPEDHLSLQSLSDPQLSPDGSKVAYVVGTVEGKTKRRSTIWIAATNGSQPPRAFTSGPQNATAPRWSPDGRTLAFLSARSAGDDSNKAADKTQIHLLSIEGGEARRLTSLEDGVRSCVWSPAGDRLACLARVPAPKDDLGFERTDSRRYTEIGYKYDGAGWDDGRRTHLFVVDARSGEAKQITSGNWNDNDPDWSPDGTRIAFVSDRQSIGTDWEGRHSDVYVVPVTGGEPVKISDHDEADTQPAFSPDGQTIAFYGSLSEGDHPRIWLAPATGGVASRPALGTPAMDYLSSGLRWADGGRAITFEAGWKGERHLFRLDLGTKQIAPVTSGPRFVSQVDVNEKAGLLAYRAEDTTHPNDLFVSDLRGGHERRLTRLNEDFLKDADLPPLDRVAWKAADGAEVEGYLMRPAGFDPSRKYPMVVWVHGGPNGMHGRQWFFDSDVLAGHGYAVFLPNPRGSSGYGEAFQRAVTNEWGGKAYTDLMGGVDAALKANPWIDGNRLGIIGHSFGGFLTNWVVTQTPRFKAAVTVAGPSNMVSIQGQRDAAYNHRRDFGGDVFQNYQKYWDYSPVRFASRVKTPVLILHGEADHRVPLAQGEEWFRALKHFGVPTELVIFPRGSHGFRTTGEPKQVVEALNMQLAWLDRYVSPAHP